MACKQAEESVTWGLTSLRIHDAPKGTSPFLSITDPSLRAMVCFCALLLLFSEGDSSS